MSHLEQVNVKINKKTGEMEVECNGFKGEGCNVIEQIENQIATSIAHREDTDERYQYQNINPATINTFG